MPLIHREGLSQVLSPEPMFLDQSHNGHPNGLLQAWCPVSPTGCLLQPGSKIWVQWFPFWYRASFFIKLIHEWEVQYTCCWLSLSMSEKTLIKINESHAMFFHELGKFRPGPVRGGIMFLRIPYRVFRGFHEKPNRGSLTIPCILMPRPPIGHTTNPRLLCQLMQGQLLENQGLKSKRPYRWSTRPRRGGRLDASEPADRPTRRSTYYSNHPTCPNQVANVRPNITIIKIHFGVFLGIQGNHFNTTRPTLSPFFPRVAIPRKQIDNQTLSISKPATKPTIPWQILTLRDGILTSHVLNHP